MQTKLETTPSVGDFVKIRYRYAEGASSLLEAKVVELCGVVGTERLQEMVVEVEFSLFGPSKTMRLMINEAHIIAPEKEKPCKRS